MTTGTGAPEARHDNAASTEGPPWAQGPVQGALDGLTRPLAQTEFVVVDLETTGGSPGRAAITEVAAVRTHGGRTGSRDLAEREFATLVNPGRPIPPHVAMLTGIDDALVASAPRIEDVLPRFIEFAAGAVLVAHNAPFDVSFLTAACAAHGLDWPRLPTLDTAALARHMLTTQEVPDCRLDTLAEFFAAGTRPSHRALDDARATAEVLHGLIRLLAERGVHTFEALAGIAEAPAPHQPRMGQLTSGIPRTAGVCLFIGAGGRVLHVMRSSDMYARACGYFAAGHTRPEIREMVGLTARIQALGCATGLEADVTAMRLIALHEPPYGNGRPYQDARANLAGAVGGNVPGGDEGAPDGSAMPGGHRREGGRDTDSTSTDGRDTDSRGTDGARRGSNGRGSSGRAEPDPAAVLALAAVPLVVAARPRFCDGWDIAWIRHGRLEGTVAIAPGAELPERAAGPVASATGAGITAAAPADGTTLTDGTPAGYAETACLLGWLESPGVRLIEVDGTWCSALRR